VSRRQRVKRTRAQQFGAELSDGLEHLRSAATIAAESAAEAVAPRADAAREALAPRVVAARDAMAPRVETARHAVGRSWDSAVQAVGPVVTAAADSARRATEEARKEAGKASRKARSGRTRRRKWPWVVGALALGVAAGTVAALLSRRNAPEWEEYEPEHQFAGASGAEAEADDTDAALDTGTTEADTEAAIDSAEKPDGAGSPEEARRAANAAKTNGAKKS
jgi:hypothetical protein